MKAVINRICASCRHREILIDGTRQCRLSHQQVEQRFVCPHYEMADTFNILKRVKFRNEKKNYGIE
ncbi:MULTISPECIES: hypothetical protein [unclassified Prevotella]|uniref:hypothetical protein n=1 Tax=unclassified Prevotella TaxID=2638335 RepID=UPI00048F5B83|nr:MULTISPECIES: hypothetical protein [unclassified Prevotella]